MSLNAESLFSLTGKTALLTGASGFLGQTMARTLLDNGANLIALGRSTRLDALVREWRAIYGESRVAAYRVDMYNRPALSRTFDRVLKSEPFVDILVNNAHELGKRTGFNVDEGRLERADWDQWLRHLTGGVYWAALAAQKFGPRMKKEGRGSIINIATMYAQVAPSPLLYEGTRFINPPGYSASKAALLALTRYIASFWGPYNVRANAILPGPFSNTKSRGQNSVGSGDPFLKRLELRTCLRRVGKPEELSGALLFLASDASSFVTGHSLVVDGGWTTT